MRSDHLLIAIATLALATTAADAAGSRPKERADPMALKATGEPRNCIASRSMTIVQAGDKALLFREGANRWYRNELRNGCSGLGRDHTLVFRNTSATQYCDLDMFDVVDMPTGMRFGGCSLGQFTPVEVPKGTRF